MRRNLLFGVGGFVLGAALFGAVSAFAAGPASTPPTNTPVTSAPVTSTPAFQQMYAACESFMSHYAPPATQSPQQ